ncbi:kinase-like domain, phloem protein 2-like protein [Tanacetum coccineum]
MQMRIVSRGVILLILLMLGIGFMFGISGLLHHVVTAIANRIRVYAVLYSSVCKKKIVCSLTTDFNLASVIQVLKRSSSIFTSVYVAVQKLKKALARALVQLGWQFQAERCRSPFRCFEHLEIQLEDIKLATNNFNEENVIGHGGFGKVYKGELSQSHSKGSGMLAFKRLDRKHGQGDAEFYKEVRMLSCYSHDNIISLLGFSSGRDEMILVYEYASRGSLDSHLKDVNLKWTQRIKICLDAAKGLSYLHDPKDTYQRLIHCDIKSANILLDKNFNAKVADFLGLSKEALHNPQNSVLVTRPISWRTPGLLVDPVFMESYTLTNDNHHLKVHVPSWKKAYEDNKLKGIILKDLIRQMDPGSLKTFAGIAYQCLNKLREERPLMSLVVEKLESALNLQELYESKSLKGYQKMLTAADPPLKYNSMEELKAILSTGFLIKRDKTVFS